MAETSSSSSMPAWYQQAAQQYLNQAGQVAGQPYQNYNGQRVANMNPLTTQGMQGYQGLLGANPYASSAGYYNDVINNGLANPYQQQVIDATTQQATQGYQDATRRTMDMFNRPGSRNFGSSAHMQGLDRNDENFARGLSQSLGALNAQGFNQNQNYRMQAAGAMPGLVGGQSNLLNQSMGAGMMGQNYQQQLLDTNYQDWLRQQGYGAQQLGVYGNALGNASGGATRTTTTQTPDPDNTSQWLGAGALGLGLLMGKRGVNG